MKHLNLVLRRLNEEKLMINLNKCEFMKRKLVYLGFVITKGTLKMDPSKVEAILSWPTPKSIGKGRSFHGLACFKRKLSKFSVIHVLQSLTPSNGIKGRSLYGLVRLKRVSNILNKG